MRLAYSSWKAIEFDATNHPGWFMVNPLTKMWVQSFWNPLPADSTDWSWTRTRVLVTFYRANPISNPWLDGSGVNLPVDFAEAGWYNNWNYINGAGVTGWLPNGVVYTGKMQYVLGGPVSKSMLDFYG